MAFNADVARDDRARPHDAVRKHLAEAAADTRTPLGQ